MVSSKASKCFQHLGIECSLFPQKLQGSPLNFLVLEEGSLDKKDCPCFGLGFEYDFGNEWEEVSLPTKYILGFSFFFFFPFDV